MVGSMTMPPGMGRLDAWLLTNTTPAGTVMRLCFFLADAGTLVLAGAAPLHVQADVRNETASQVRFVAVVSMMRPRVWRPCWTHVLTRWSPELDG